MNKRISWSVIIAAVGMTAIVWAHEMPIQKPGSKEFQQIKQLTGNWMGVTTHPGTAQKPEPVSVEFQMTAAGSAIEEKLMKGTPHEMVDMYTDENGKLAMTHYCAMGNQPHMVLKQAGPNQVSLEMASAPGVDAAKDAHMHALTLEFPDANHLTEKWTSYANGKPAEQVVMEMARVK